MTPTQTPLQKAQAEESARRAKGREHMAALRATGVAQIFNAEEASEYLCINVNLIIENAKQGILHSESYVIDGKRQFFFNRPMLDAFREKGA